MLQAANEEACSVFSCELHQGNATISNRELKVTNTKYAEMDFVAWGSVLGEEQCVIILQVNMHIMYSLINTALCVLASSSLLPKAVCAKGTKGNTGGLFACMPKGSLSQNGRIPTISQYKTPSWCHIAIVSFNRRDLASPVFFFLEKSPVYPVPSLHCFIYLCIFN